MQTSFPQSQASLESVDPMPVKEPEPVVLLPRLISVQKRSALSASASTAQPDPQPASLANHPAADRRLLDCLEQGKVRLQQGDLAGAIEQYRQAVALDSQSGEAYQHLAQALSQQGNLEESAVCYRRAIELTAPPPKLELATDASPAVRVVKSRRKSLSGDQLSDSLDGEAASIPWYEEAAFYLQQGKVHCGLKNWDAALESCQQAIELLGPRAAEAYHLLGQAWQGKGQLEEAKQSYTQAITLQPESAEIYAYLGSVYVEQQQLDEALTCYQKAIQLKPDFAGAHWELGELWQKLGDRNQATDHWYQALQLKPTWATAQEHWKLGTALAEQGKFVQAEQVYHRAIEFEPNFAEAYHNLGVVLGKQQRWQEALNYHRQATELSPEKPQMWAGLGRAFAAMENWEEAIASYQHITKLKLDQPQGYAILQHGLTQLEQCQKALIARSYSDLGDLFSQQEKWQEAIRCYREAIARYPNHAKVHASLGKALIATQQWEESIAVYQQAMKLAPDATEYYLAFGDAMIRRDQARQLVSQPVGQSASQPVGQPASQPAIQPIQPMAVMPSMPSIPSMPPIQPFSPALQNQRTNPLILKENEKVHASVKTEFTLL